MSDQKAKKEPDQKNSESIEELKEKIAVLEKRIEENLNGWKRAKADYINLQKETEKRQQELIQFANASLILQILPINDHFKLAFSQLPEIKDEETKKWVQGIEHIKNQIQATLKTLGIEEIKTVGEKFNPERHEAVEKRKAEGKEKDIIIEEVKPGYLMHGKVLEAAKVVVSE